MSIFLLFATCSCVQKQHSSPFDPLGKQRKRKLKEEGERERERERKPFTVDCSRLLTVRIGERKEGRKEAMGTGGHKCAEVS